MPYVPESCCKWSRVRFCALFCFWRSGLKHAMDTHQVGKAGHTLWMTVTCRGVWKSLKVMWYKSGDLAYLFISQGRKQDNLFLRAASVSSGIGWKGRFSRFYMFFCVAGKNSYTKVTSKNNWQVLTNPTLVLFLFFILYVVSTKVVKYFPLCSAWHCK